MNKNLLNKYCRKFGFEIHGTGYMQSLKKSLFKEDTFEIQKDLIKNEKPVIFDIGANRGNVIVKYLEHFPKATFFAFEPFPDSFQQLKNRFSNSENVYCYEKAVAYIGGFKEFFVNRNVDTNSLLQPQKTGLSSDKQVNNLTTINVETISLDQFCITEHIKHIDILKMDIQGGELDALKGLDRMLSKSTIDLIYSEVYFIEQYKEQPLFHDISKFLFKYGYRLQDIYNPIYGKGNLAWADVIFVKE